MIWLGGLGDVSFSPREEHDRAKMYQMFLR